MNPFFRLAAGNLLVLAFLGGFGCEARQVSRTSQAQPTQHPSGTSGQVLPPGSLSVARAAHTATLLLNGTVLLAGGMEGAGATAESYDPAQGSFAPGGRMFSERSGGHAAGLLPTGSVLWAGGWSGRAIPAAAERYDPTSNTFSATGPMSSPRSA